MHRKESLHHMSTAENSDQLTQVYRCSYNAGEFMKYYNNVQIKVCAGPSTCICH